MNINTILIFFLLVFFNNEYSLLRGNQEIQLNVNYSRLIGEYSISLEGDLTGSDSWVLQSSNDLNNWEDLDSFKENNIVRVPMRFPLKARYFRARKGEMVVPYRDDFIKHKQIWSDANLNDYVMEINWGVSWFFWHGLVTVQNNKVISAEAIDSNWFEPPQQRTVDEWFNHLRYYIDNRADQIDVIYDKELGYTKSVYIDFERMLADEEQNWRIIRVTPK